MSRLTCDYGLDFIPNKEALAFDSAVVGEYSKCLNLVLTANFRPSVIEQFLLY